MKILTSSQIRELDAYTITSEPISSWQLMERASRAFVQWLLCKFENSHPYHIFCGKGNNGGDGLAIARILSEKGLAVDVYIVEHRPEGSPDFEENRLKLQNYVDAKRIHSSNDIQLPADGIVIDALLGSGLNKSVEGVLAEVIGVINDAGMPVVSVDIASGLFADQPNRVDDVIVKPTYTVSFQVPKCAFFMPDCAPFVGEWQLVDIGLDSEYIDTLPSSLFVTTRENLPHLLKKRGKFTHKGTYGHGLMIAGSYGKMGAAVLASKACLRSGVGLLTTYTPACGYDIMQISVPEAMTLTDPEHHFLTVPPELEGYTAVGVGPGIGTKPATLETLTKILRGFQGRMVLDADALNLLALAPDLLDILPEGTILTPHPKEFSRLAGPFLNSYDAINRAKQFAERYGVIICLKGAHTAVVLPDGSVFFNSTGNPGMATGGSGDVLTGVMLALLAQGYLPAIAARLAVFVHGDAGDRAAALRSEASLVASDLIDHLRWD